MIPNLDPRAMAMAMKKLGIKQTEIHAKEVIIKTDDKDIIINNPVVTKINMMAQESFQITGDINEISKKAEITNDDIEIIMRQAGCSKEEAENAVKDANGDIAGAILKLKEKYF